MSYEYFITSVNSAGESEMSDSAKISLPLTYRGEKEKNSALTWVLIMILAVILLVIIGLFLARKKGRVDEGILTWEEE